MASDGLTKKGARRKKNRDHFLVFQNKVISKKKFITLGVPPSWCYYEEIEQYFAFGGSLFEVV